MFIAWKLKVCQMKVLNLKLHKINSLNPTLDPNEKINLYITFEIKSWPFYVENGCKDK